LRHKLINEKIFFPGSELLHQDEFLTALFTRRADNKEWLQSISELIYGIARSQYKKDDSALYDQLFVEAIMKVYTQCQRLVHLLDSGDLDMQQATIGKLLVRTLSS
jgi:hypothetical protein